MGEGRTVEELFVQDDVVEPPETAAEDPVGWAFTHLGVTVNTHDRLQTSFVATLRAASVDELRVLAFTYAGLDEVAEIQRRGELAWKAIAARAALTARLGTGEGVSADFAAPA